MKDRRKLPVLRSQYARPPTRAHCIVGEYNTGSFIERRYGMRRCEALDCRHNLDVQRSEDVPGRRHNGLAPPWTINPLPVTGPSCVLDVADLNPDGLSSGDVARIMGVSKRRVEQIVKDSKVGTGAVRVLRVERGG